MTKIKEENLGVIYALIESVLWGLFPIVVNQGVKFLPPLTFLAMSLFFGIFPVLIYAKIKKKLAELKVKKAYKYLSLVSLFIVVIPYVLFFIGSKMTSGINSSMLALAEIIFTLIFTHFIGEKTTAYKLFGAGGVFFGAVFLLWHGNLSLNLGDILIILSTLTYPLGNFYAKKAMHLVSSEIILLTRLILGFVSIFILALIFEPGQNLRLLLLDNWFIIVVLNGFILMGIAKLIWYNALKRLDISKAISLSMTAPIFSLIILILFFKETVTLPQSIGIALMFLGLYFSVKRKSVDPALTLYAADI